MCARLRSSLDTQVVHAGRESFSDLGVHAPPIDRSSTYPLHDLDAGGRALEELAEGEPSASSPVYSRLHNPTVARWERAIAELEHAEGAVAFASGMASITALLLSAVGPGGHLVAVRPVYGGTDHLLATGLLGTRVTWCAPDEISGAVESDTKLVLLETPANPTLSLADIGAVVQQAAGVPVAVDNTFATPILQRPLDLGATFVIHSATKYLGGHGDVTAGVVATDAEHARPLRQVRILTGGILDPDAAYLLHRSLPTLALRVRTAQHNADTLAARLARLPGVTRVRYPGLPGQDPTGLIGRQMAGPGAMVAFEIDGGMQAAAAVMSGVRLITPAVSLGSVDTLIQHPAGLTHRLVDTDALKLHGVSPGLLRLSVGIEDVDDVWEDLSRAIELATRRAA